MSNAVVGAGKQRTEPKTPLVAAFEHVLGRLGVKGMTQALDEELLTGFLLGGLASSFPLIAKKYGHPDSARQCSWKRFKKSATQKDRDSEAETGADLALVLWQSPDRARVVVIQAKKGKGSKEDDGWKLDFNRIPSDPGERRTQFVMLVATAYQYLRFMHEADLTTTRELVEELEALMPAVDGVWGKDDAIVRFVQSIGWIHYLVYVDGEPKCVALKDVDTAALPAEFNRVRGVNWTSLSEKGIAFNALLAEGVRGGKGWLTLNADQLKVLLPSLIHLMPTLVVDESGSAGLELVPQDGLEFSGESFQAKKSKPDQLAALEALFNDSDSPINPDEADANESSLKNSSAPTPARLSP